MKLQQLAKRVMPRSQKRLPQIVSIVCLLLILMLIWVPVGLHTTVAVFEEWRAVKLVTTRGVGDMVPSTNSPTRPLRWFPHVVAYYLTPNSHVGYNIYLVSLFIMRGVITFLLMRRLLRNTALGLAVAALYIVYPAGHGWFTFRAITIQTALVLGLLSLNLLSLHWDRPRRWLWLFILGTQTISLLTYELLYVVFGLAPLLLIWLQGHLHLSRRLIRVSLLWYSTYSILALRFLYIMATDSGGYASDRVNRGVDDNLAEKFVTGIQNMFSNHLDGWRSISNDYVFLSLLIGLITAITLGGLIRARQEDSEVAFSWKSFPALLLVGPGFMILTYTQYVLVEDVSRTFRVYFVPSLGAALFVVVTVYGLARISRLENVLFPLFIGFFMFVGGQKAIEQNTYYADQSLRIQRLLSTIVATVPEPVEDTVIVVIDEQEIYQGGDVLAGRSDHLESALNYIYDTNVKAVLCMSDPRRQKVCRFTEDGIVETSTAQRYTRKWPYEDVIIFYTRWDDTIEMLEEIPLRYYPSVDNYDPHRLIENNAKLPKKVHTFFSCWPFTECDTLPTTHPSPVTEAHIDFSEPVPGSGWQQFPSGHFPSKDIVLNAATLEFTLASQPQYHLSFVATTSAPDLADDLIVEVNDQPIPITYSWENYQLVFSNETPFSVDNETTIIRFRFDDGGNLKPFRFVSLDIAATP